MLFVVFSKISKNTLTTQACRGSSKVPEVRMRKEKKKEIIEKWWICIEINDIFAKILGRG